MRIYYGWCIVGISLVLQMLTVGSTMNTFGMYVVEASKDLGLSRTSANLGLVMISLGTALFSPFVGRMLDVFPVRRIMAAGALLFGGAFELLAFSHNVWLSAFALAVPLPLGTASVGHLASTTVVARWFEAQRGRALALSMVGMSLGTVVLAPTIGFLIKNLGWRECLMVLGGVFTVVFLVLVPFMRERPGPNDIEPVPANAPPAAARAPADAKPVKVMDILRMPIFWVLSIAVALALSVLQTVAASIIPLAQESGISVTKASTLLSILGAMSLLGKLGLAVIGDKIDRVVALMAIFLFQTFACALLLVGQSYGLLLVCAALQGVCAAAISPVFMALLAQRVGAASFGTAQGAAALVMAACSMSMLVVGGKIYDVTGSYQIMFAAFTGISLLAALLVLASKWLPSPQPAPVAA